MIDSACVGQAPIDVAEILIINGAHINAKDKVHLYYQ